MKEKNADRLISFAIYTGTVAVVVIALSIVVISWYKIDHNLAKNRLTVKFEFVDGRYRVLEINNTTTGTISNLSFELGTKNQKLVYERLNWNLE